MNPTANDTVKKKEEVVLVIPREEEATAVAAADSSKSRRSIGESNQKLPISAEISNSSPSSGKLQRPPNFDTLRRCPSTSSPASTRSKSRLVEQPPPAAPIGADHHDLPRSSPSHGSPTTCSPQATAEEDEDDEDQDFYQRFSERRGRRCGRVRARDIIEWSVLVLAMGFLIASLTVHRLQDFVILGLEIWRWCLMVTVICGSRLFSQWFVNILVSSIERNFLLTKNVMYYVYGLKRSVQVCIWFGLVLLAWCLLLNHGVHRSPKTVRILYYVTHILALLLIGSVIWLLKTLLVKILALYMHRNRFFERIQESLFHQYVLQMLMVMNLPDKVRHTRSIGQLSFWSMGKGKVKDKGRDELKVINMAKFRRMSQEKVSPWRMKGLIDAVRSPRLMVEEKNDHSFEITSEWEAKAVASRIFKNVAKPGCNYIEEEDLLKFLSEEEVFIVFPQFEGVWETGKIKKSALKNWVVKAYFNRKSLALSLNDTETAVNQLHNLATAGVLIVMTVITVLFMELATTRVIVVVSSQVLLAAFIFGNTCKTAFESIILLFVLHPFDVGDRCVIGGKQMIVEEMNLLTTVFLGDDNEKIRYPNSILVNQPITNFYRSPDMGDSVLFSVDIKSSMEFIGALKARIKLYIESKPNHWRPTHSIVVKDIVGVNKMTLALYVTHTMNYQNIEEKNSRRSDLALELYKIFEGLSIQYNLLP